MKKIKRFLFLPLLILLAFTLTACGKHASNNVYQKVKESKTIVWGVRADTRLFGLTNIKTGHIEGFEIDLAKALTKQMLGKDAKTDFVTTTANTRIPLLKNGNVDAVLATRTITPESVK